jgi:hypothetical protein
VIDKATRGNSRSARHAGKLTEQPFRVKKRAASPLIPPRTAIATSIGTLLFLFLGVATCMRIMLAFTTDFDAQLATFLGFIAGGSVAMYVALNWRTRSNAITLAASLAPLATFIAITHFLVGNHGVVFLVTTFTYGFATIAMLMPAIHVFDVATGGATAREE